MAGKSTIQVAAAVIEKEGRFLIARRNPQTHLGGYWEFPGGKREEGESVEACLIREVQEELGVTVINPTLFRVVHHEYSEKSVELHFFFCSIIEDEAKPLECAEVQWVKPKDLAHYSFPPADVEVVTYLMNRSPVRGH